MVLEGGCKALLIPQGIRMEKACIRMRKVNSIP
jgi:hypothetical protein